MMGGNEIFFEHPIVFFYHLRLFYFFYNTDVTDLVKATFYSRRSRSTRAPFAGRGTLFSLAITEAWRFATGVTDNHQENLLYPKMYISILEKCERRQ